MSSNYYGVYSEQAQGVYTSQKGARDLVEANPGALWRKFTDAREARHFSMTGKVLQLPPVEEISCYTDGACSNNGGSNPRGGIGVWFAEGDERNYSGAFCFPPPVTNQRAEIGAAILALHIVLRDRANKGLKEPVRVVIHTDSEYLCKAMTSWIKIWLKNGWRSDTIANRDLFQQLHELTKGLSSVRYVHVRGHAGIAGNEAADELARRGAPSAHVNKSADEPSAPSRAVKRVVL